MEKILDNFKKIVYNVYEARSHYRKPDDEIRIMAVTKTQSPENVNIAIDGGITLLGENRVQEFLSKRDSYKPAEVHFIGALQTRKVRQIVPLVSMIHSVDSVKLLNEIDKVSRENDIVSDILIEVNIGGEISKSGVKPGEVHDFAEQAAEFKGLRLRGLMTIPPPENSDKYFGAMQELFENLKSKYSLDTLSMGMSGDYINAVRYGSTLIRIGSALFGARE
ncbi:MAG: YggS family pyridoxal phosphate-dependent enzyme [Ruminococcus sp.]|jgi:pyridoxal phosphate enzyme (YggS family)|nr:YggS family pyridoxal phosphate-dependent enzyme [Ruminococcus sp.]